MYNLHRIMLQYTQLWCSWVLLNVSINNYSVIHAVPHVSIHEVLNTVINIGYWPWLSFGDVRAWAILLLVRIQTWWTCTYVRYSGSIVQQIYHTCDQFSSVISWAKFYCKQPYSGLNIMKFILHSRILQQGKKMFQKYLFPPANFFFQN